MLMFTYKNPLNTNKPGERYSLSYSLKGNANPGFSGVGGA